MPQLLPGAWRRACGHLGRSVAGGAATAAESTAGRGLQKGYGCTGGWPSDHLGAHEISTTQGAHGAVAGAARTLCCLEV